MASDGEGTVSMAYILPFPLPNVVLRRARAPQTQCSPHTFARRPHRASLYAPARAAALDAPVKEDVRTSLERLFSMPSVGSPETDTDHVRVRTDPGKMYKVMLFNDQGNERSYVARVIQKVCPEISPEEAWAIMMKAHTDGSAVVAIYPFEQAEMVCQMLCDNGLLSEISEV